MKKVEIFTYYSFGYNYYILLNESSNYSNQKFLESINEYLRFISNLNLKVTKSSLDLQNFDEQIDILKKKCRGQSKTTKVSVELHKTIISKIKDADKTLDRCV